jgi:hypothetical protein
MLLEQRQAHGPLAEYPPYPHGTFGEAATRPAAGSRTGHGQRRPATTGFPVMAGSSPTATCLNAGCATVPESQPF